MIKKCYVNTIVTRSLPKGIMLREMVLRMLDYTKEDRRIGAMQYQEMWSCYHEAVMARYTQLVEEEDVFYGKSY